MIKSKSEEGLTLIEVMIAMLVLLIGMLGVMAMQYYAISGNAVSRELRTATNLSYEIIEQMKGTPYGSLASGTDTIPTTEQPGGEQALTGAMTGGIQRRWWVVGPGCSSLGPNGDACTAVPAPGCATVPVSPVVAIRARTCWTDSNGTFHSISLDTLRWDEG